MKTEYGIQLYSLRDLTETDLEAGLRAASELGYRYVEFAGFFGHSAETVASWLEKYNLAVSGTHTGWKELTPDAIADTIAYHKIIGNQTIIIPGFDQSTAENVDEVVDVIRFAEPVLSENGIRLGFHNHAREFIRSSYGVFVEEELWKRTRVSFELDTFWIFAAGLDPVEIMEKMKDRLLPCIHLKDGIRKGDGTGAGKAIGEGEAPVLAVREKALQMGLTMIVESEGLDPTGVDEVGRCIRYLRTLDC